MLRGLDIPSALTVNSLLWGQGILWHHLFQEHYLPMDQSHGTAHHILQVSDRVMLWYSCVTYRSRINGDVRARTQMASLVCSGIVLLATYLLLPWLSFLPKCVLASMYVDRRS